MIDAALVWVMCVGVWPFADPGHSADTLMSVIDLAVHWTAAGVLAARWKFVRRSWR